MPNTIPIFSEKMKFVLPIHKYGRYDADFPYDIVCGLTFQDVLRYVVVHKRRFELKSISTVHYYSRVLEAVRELDPSVGQLTLTALDGFWQTEYTSVHHTTLFLYLRDLQNRLFIAQIDFDNMDPDDGFSVYIVRKFLASKRVVVGLMIKENYLYTDTKSVDSNDTYIVYVDAEIGESFGGKSVKGVRVLVARDEKEEFIANHPEHAFIMTRKPVVDEWLDDIVLYKLPDDAEAVTFQFSNGLAIARFSQGTEAVNEGFSV